MQYFFINLTPFLLQNLVTLIEIADGRSQAQAFPLLLKDHTVLPRHWRSNCKTYLDWSKSNLLGTTWRNCKSDSHQKISGVTHVQDPASVFQLIIRAPASEFCFDTCIPCPDVRPLLDSATSGKKKRETDCPELSWCNFLLLQREFLLSSWQLYLRATNIFVFKWQWNYDSLFFNKPTLIGDRGSGR